jgi:hypothetical protein
MKARLILPKAFAAAIIVNTAFCVDAPCESPIPLQAEVIQIADQPETWPHNKVKVTLRNTGRESIRILKPLDGSDYCWHLPFYRFSVKDKAGNPVPLGSRCGVSGLWADTKWPDDYLLVLKPGGSFSTEFYLPQRIPADGIYKVKFEYVMDLTLKEKQFKYPNGLWQGIAVSREMDFKLKKQDT